MHRKAVYLISAAAVTLCLASGAGIGITSASESGTLDGKTVFIDPGHGRGSGGEYAGYIEHTKMLEIAQLLEAELEALGAQVVMLRTDNRNVPLAKRVSIINRHALGLVREHKMAQLREINADGTEETEALREQLNFDISEIMRLEAVMQSVIDDPERNRSYYNDPYDYRYRTQIHPELRRVFEYCDHPAAYGSIVYVSLHSNATEVPIDRRRNGVEAFYTSNAPVQLRNYFREYGNAKTAWGRLYADLLAEAVSDAAGMKNNGSVDYVFYMTRETNIPGVLLEIGYHTNASDRAKLRSAEYCERIVEAIALSTAEYFELVSGEYGQMLLAESDGSAAGDGSEAEGGLEDSTDSELLRETEELDDSDGSAVASDDVAPPRTALMTVALFALSAVLSALVVAVTSIMASRRERKERVQAVKDKLEQIKTDKL